MSHAVDYWANFNWPAYKQLFQLLSWALRRGQGRLLRHIVKIHIIHNFTFKQAFVEAGMLIIHRLMHECLKSTFVSKYKNWMAFE